MSMVSLGPRTFAAGLTSSVSRVHRHVLGANAGFCSQSSTSSNTYTFHPGFREDLRSQFSKSFLIFKKFVSENEEENLMKEVEPHLKRLVYEKDHWDEAIVNFRETERKHWNSANAPVIQRIRDFSFDPTQKLLPFVHVLDLSEKGHIKPHIDSSRFCGSTVAVLSLLSDAVARFVHDEDKSQIVDCVVKRRSLYLMKDESRYNFTHEILPSGANGVEKGRRISVVCRCEP